MNGNGTYLSIYFNGKTIRFTATQGYCKFCEEYTHVLASGTDQDYNNWTYCCIQDLGKFSCKKQHCNYCNKKSVVHSIPKICEMCSKSLVENYIDMIKMCRFPDKTRVECGCKYCQKMM